MKRKEVCSCWCLGRSAISSSAGWEGGLVLGRVEFQTSVPRDAKSSGCGQT